MSTERYMVFDVESVGLHGEGFAVGWVVIDASGIVLHSAEYGCDPILAREGATGDLAWVQEHCVVPFNCHSPHAVRRMFWEAWTYAKKRGCLLVADCAWPVEARFLEDCVADDPSARNWEGPYPLLDVAPLMHALGGDPAKAAGRLPDELPEHSPLADARQSARLFVTLLRECAG